MVSYLNRSRANFHYQWAKERRKPTGVSLNAILKPAYNVFPITVTMVTVIGIVDPIWQTRCAYSSVTSWWVHLALQRTLNFKHAYSASHEHFPLPSPTRWITVHSRKESLVWPTSQKLNMKIRSSAMERLQAAFCCWGCSLCFCFPSWSKCYDTHAQYARLQDLDDDDRRQRHLTCSWITIRPIDLNCT